MLQMIVGWELVGVCSFALIGHWWEEKPNSDAALKAFLTNRVGDMGLLIGMIILFWSAGTVEHHRHQRRMAVDGDIGHNTLLIASLCLLAAVMSQVGPVRPAHLAARRHGRPHTGVGAHPRRDHGRRRHLHGGPPLPGLLGRHDAIAGSSINMLALVGAVTLVGAGLLAFVQDDIKKVLAYSTVSQLGYMVMALGVGAWTAAMFHLFTHAFFKAGLFLGAGLGEPLRAQLRHEDRHGRHAQVHAHARRGPSSSARSPWPGMFPLAGFWSKDEILVGTGGWGLLRRHRRQRHLHRSRWSWASSAPHSPVPT